MHTGTHEHMHTLLYEGTEGGPCYGLIQERKVTDGTAAVQSERRTVTGG